ncbi:MAG: C40 family peptidase [Nannocystaceae bacterium]|nr:NlpC/P60 family protein [bacterium]
MAANVVNSWLAEAREALRRLEDSLAQRHGLCRIEVSLVPTEGAVTVGGHVLVDRLRAPVLAAVRRAAPDGWTVLDGMEVVQGGPWYALETARVVYASASGGAVVTVLHPEDGPVERLGGVAGVSLVRDRCGTAAWLREPLGAPVEAPRLPRPSSRDPAAFLDAARSFEGTAYRLGGTDHDAIDCSGVVQRAAWGALRVALPRNTGDLWGLGAQPGKPPAGRGHLVFVWTRGESLRHVGIVGEDMVVHASLSRRAVVSDPAQRFYAHAARIDHLPFEAILALGERAAGKPNILAAGVVLGRVESTASATVADSGA